MAADTATDSRLHAKLRGLIVTATDVQQISADASVRSRHCHKDT